MGDELFNKGVNGSTSFDEEDNFARFFQLGNEFLDGMSTLNVGTCRAKGRPVRS